MSVYKFELSDWDKTMGVTEEQVAEVLPKVLVRDGMVIVPTGYSPAVGHAVARCAIGGNVVYKGLNELGMPVYRTY